ncbi:MAG: beta-ketoacyl synthase N-terminal-like domain-containing protein [Ahrensia sp.]|nr:beta-ketoacyl synthase N-terminal-like domain-containing protein [Ahrensia sp.]
MRNFIDTKGRPIIAITGAGIVSSLGVGKTENWTKLKNGQSGIHAITRFPIDHLKTTIAGTVDFLTKPEDGCASIDHTL